MSHKRNFYWESETPPLHLNPEHKYLIYFKGCFCPPHRGHFQTIERFLSHGKHVSAIIDQMGCEKRHGVPFEYSRKIWNIYINQLLDKSRVSLQHFDSFWEILSHPFAKDADSIIYIRGIEGTDYHKTKKQILFRYKELINKFRFRGQQLIFNFLERPHANSLCATQFVNSIIKYKSWTCPCKYKNLSYFFPKRLTKYHIKYIVKLLQKCDLH